jgi:hypothetical protein
MDKASSGKIIKGPNVSATIRVTHLGFPGKDSRALAKKLRKELERQTRTSQLPRYSLVLIMSGTNDVVGLSNSLDGALESIQQMHSDVQAINCRASHRIGDEDMRQRIACAVPWRC